VNFIGFHPNLLTRVRICSGAAFLLSKSARLHPNVGDVFFVCPHNAKQTRSLSCRMDQRSRAFAKPHLRRFA
jgi:hypothetical protein